MSRKIKKPVVWSGKTTSFHHNDNDTPNPPGTAKGFRKVWLLDVQWTDCPAEVEEQVQQMWEDHDNGNDRYIVKTDILVLLDDYPIVAQYVLEQHPQIEDTELIIIHWWW